MENIKWKKLFICLFILSVVISYVFAGKSLIISQKSAEERVDDGNGISHVEVVIRTYHDNYAAIGGAIAFGIIGGASLIALSITSIKEKRLLWCFKV